MGNCSRSKTAAEGISGKFDGKLSSSSIHIMCIVTFIDEQSKLVEDSSSPNVILYKQRVEDLCKIVDHIIRGMRDSAKLYTRFSQLVPRIKRYVTRFSDSESCKY